MQKETKFKTKAIARLKTLDRAWFFKSHELSISGIPDIIGCVRGRFFAWELKKDAKSKPTKLQSFILQKIEDCGGITAVVHPDNLEEELYRLQSAYTLLRES